jgi:peptidyl-prolyl cis-trans isomerase C
MMPSKIFYSEDPRSPSLQGGLRENPEYDERRVKTKGGVLERMKREFFSMVLGLMLIGIAGSWAWAEDNAEGPWDYIPPVVASVNGEDIYAEEFKELYYQVGEYERASGKAKETKSSEERKRDVLEQLIIRKLLSQKVKEMDIKLDSRQLDQRVLATEARYGGRASFEEYLESRGRTRAQYIAELEASLKVENFLEQELYSSLVVEPDEVRAYYDAHPEEFQVPEQIRGRHILIKVEPGAPEAERKDARAAIDAAAERIKSGEPFEEVAKEVSQEAAAVRGGDMGYVSKGQMKPAFEEIAFNLAVGEVSRVFETEYGYHLMKVEEKIPVSKLSFDVVRPEIEEFLRQNKQERAQVDYIEGLRERAVIFKEEF